MCQRYVQHYLGKLFVWGAVKYEGSLVSACVNIGRLGSQHTPALIMAYIFRRTFRTDFWIFALSSTVYIMRILCLVDQLLLNCGLPSFFALQNVLHHNQ